MIKTINRFTNTYADGTSKDLLCKKEERKCNKIIKQYKND